MEETSIEPRSLKLTIKLKGQNNNPSSNSVSPNKIEEETNPSANNSPVVENNTPEDQENQSLENSEYQLVLHDPLIEPENLTGPTGDRPPSSSNPRPRVSPPVTEFTVQCADCFKWRIIPTKERYEEIRENITNSPFVCENAKDWRAEISCADPPDIVQDGSRLWAIDKPDIPKPPNGWQRLLTIRGEGSSKFADVYYTAPSGKRLRSMVETQRYLDEQPHYKESGVKLSQFSFQIPKPLQKDYLRKRPATARSTPPNDAPGPSEVNGAITPLSWASPDADAELQLGGPGLSTRYFESPTEIQMGKRIRTSSPS